MEQGIKNREESIARSKSTEAILGELARRALFEQGEINGQRFAKRGEFGEALAKDVNRRLDENFTKYGVPVKIATINNLLSVMVGTDGDPSQEKYSRASVSVKAGPLSWEIFWGASTLSLIHI